MQCCIDVLNSHTRTSRTLLSHSSFHKSINETSVDSTDPHFTTSDLASHSTPWLYHTLILKDSLLQSFIHALASSSWSLAVVTGLVYFVVDGCWMHATHRQKLDYSTYHY